MKRLFKTIKDFFKPKKAEPKPLTKEDILQEVAWLKMQKERYELRRPLTNKEAEEYRERLKRKITEDEQRLKKCRPEWQPMNNLKGWNQEEEEKSLFKPSFDLYEPWASNSTDTDSNNTSDSSSSSDSGSNID